MNRRIRKKLLVGEYAVRGFHVGFVTHERLAWSLKGSPDDAFDGPGSQLMERAMRWGHDREWFFGPGGDGKRWGYFVVPYHDQVNRPPIRNPGLTEADRAQIIEWLRAQPEIAKVHAGPLIDAWKDRSAKSYEDYYREEIAALGDWP